MLITLTLVMLLQAQPNAAPGGAVKDFLEWRSQQPADTPHGQLIDRYREHLKQKGLSESEIKEVHLAIERERWDRVYSNPAPSFNTAPNAFLTDVVKTLKPGRALEIGMGQGRNSVYLATLGWDVTGFDISETGMAVARKSAEAAGVKITTINSTMESFDYGVEQWDLIVATYEGAGWRDKAVQGLKPGGIVVVEGFLRTPQTPQGASFGPNELVKMFLDLNLRILQYEDVYGKPDWSSQPGHVIRLCAQKTQYSSNPLVELWSRNKPAFGVYVPNEAAASPDARGRRGPGAGRDDAGQGPGPGMKPVHTEPGGQKLAANPLYDFVFLNLEEAYDSAAVHAIASGLRKGGSSNRRTALIVRVSAFHQDAAAGRARMREVFAAGGDGITFPHVESLDEARQILAAARAEKINVWSPGNPNGDRLLMMMVEDPAAVAQAAAFADLNGYSILACGIGSLLQALKGDVVAAEAGTQRVLAETKRAKLANMITATSENVETRVREGFLGILAQGPDRDGAIKIGRAAAGR